MRKNEYGATVKRYLTSLPSAQKSPQTVRSYTNALNSFLSFLDEQKQGLIAEQTETERITTADVVDYRTMLHENGVSSNTIRQYMVDLSVFFAWAVRMGKAKANPIDKAEMPKREQIEYDLLSLEEIQTLLNSTAKELPRMNRKNTCRNRAIVLLLLQTGIRNSELRELRLCDLDFESGAITIRHGKGDKRRLVPFPEQARRAIVDYLDSGVRPDYCGTDDYLFGTEADENGHRRTDGGQKSWKPITSAGLLQMVNAYTEKACGHSVGVHALRHAAASLWDEMGISLRLVQGALGHSSLAVTERIYVEVLDKQKAANAINQAFSSARA